jgi:hypothetical protein
MIGVRMAGQLSGAVSGLSAPARTDSGGPFRGPPPLSACPACREMSGEAHAAEIRSAETRMQAERRCEQHELTMTS